MSSKRSKLTADTARERITSLEESIDAREQRLEQIKARIARSSTPEEKLLAAKERTERRLLLEREQVQKLRRLLGRRDSDVGHESGEFFGAEELDVLHRSFEEVREDLSQVKMRLEGTDIPRDLPGRLGGFEERLSRREEADSDLFTQILNLQTALDEERQTVRRLSRRIREQDQNLEALREAVEDSVVATVDLAERMEELEESLVEDKSTVSESPQSEILKNQVMNRLETLSLRLDEYAADLRSIRKESAKPAVSEPTGESQLILEALGEFEFRLEELENKSVEFLHISQQAQQSVAEQREVQQTVPSRIDEPTERPEAAVFTLVETEPTPCEIIGLPESSSRNPAKFSSQGYGGRLLANFSGTSPLRKK